MGTNNIMYMNIGFNFLGHLINHLLIKALKIHPNHITSNNFTCMKQTTFNPRTTSDSLIRCNSAIFEKPYPTAPKCCLHCPQKP